MLTILATAVAAVYIYYQMRLVMRRWTLALPAHVESSSTSNITLSEWADEKGQDGLYTRRRWMASNGSDEYVNRCEGRTLTRSWSMPEHMSEEELKEWVKSLENEEYASSASAQLSAETGDDSASESAANIKINIQMELGSLLPTSWPPVTPRFPEPSNNVMKSPGLGIPQSVSRDSNCSSPSPPLLELDNAYTPTLASVDHRILGEYPPVPPYLSMSPVQFLGRHVHIEWGDVRSRTKPMLTPSHTALVDPNFDACEVTLVLLCWVGRWMTQHFISVVPVGEGNIHTPMGGRAEAVMPLCRGAILMSWGVRGVIQLALLGQDTPTAHQH